MAPTAGKNKDGEDLVKQGLAKYGPTPSGNPRPSGTTDDGTKFLVWETADIINTFLASPPSQWSWGDRMTAAITAVHAYLFFFAQISATSWMWIFIFWRLCYDVGLGYVLDRQSKERWLTKWFDAHPRGDTFHKYMEAFVSGSMLEPKYSYDASPNAFNAWLLYRQLATCVLGLDFVAYSLFCFKSITLADEWTLAVVLQYIVGLGLLVFNIWAKWDAHRVVKDLAWYWGDFFFLVDTELTFDGIFQMFPHPMYTMGYAWFYGSALIARSYTVLYASIFGHFMQLLFLALVENPHIDRTYGSSVSEQDPERKKLLFDPHKGYFFRDLLFFRNIDLFRSSDLFNLIIVVQSAVMLVFGAPTSYWIFHAVAWRLFHSFGLGSVLSAQAHRGFWTVHWTKVGGSKKKAFESWKTLFNLSLTMTHVSMFELAVSQFPAPSWNWMGWEGASMVIGACMIALNIWSSLSTLEVLGEFGWFYGDFFIDELPSTLYYTGIYRFLNNPEVSLGFAGYYGLALITGSPIVWAMAIFSHASHGAFVRYVERPHMARLYGTAMRPEAGTISAIKDGLENLAEGAPVVKSALGAASGAARALEKSGLTAVDRVMYEVFNALDNLIPGSSSDAPRRLARVGADGTVKKDSGKGGKKGGKKDAAAAAAPVASPKAEEGKSGSVDMAGADRPASPIGGFTDDGSVVAPQYVAPTTPIEKKLVKLWAEEMGFEQGEIGVKDELFAVLGCTSLTAQKLVGAMNSTFGVRMSLTSLYGKPTIEALAEEIVSASKKGGKSKAE